MTDTATQPLVYDRRGLDWVTPAELDRRNRQAKADAVRVALGTERRGGAS